MGSVRRKTVNTGFQEEFSKLKEIKGKRMHRDKLHVYVSLGTGMSFVSIRRLLESF